MIFRRLLGDAVDGRDGWCGVPDSASEQIAGDRPHHVGHARAAAKHLAVERARRDMSIRGNGCDIDHLPKATTNKTNKLVTIAGGLKMFEALLIVHPNLR